MRQSRPPPDEPAHPSRLAARLCELDAIEPGPEQERALSGIVGGPPGSVSGWHVPRLHRGASAPWFDYLAPNPGFRLNGEHGPSYHPRLSGT